MELAIDVAALALYDVIIMAGTFLCVPSSHSGLGLLQGAVPIRRALKCIQKEVESRIPNCMSFKAGR